MNEMANFQSQLHYSKCPITHEHQLSQTDRKSAGAVDFGRKRNIEMRFLLRCKDEETELNKVNGNVFVKSVCEMADPTWVYSSSPASLVTKSVVCGERSICELPRGTEKVGYFISSYWRPMALAARIPKYFWHESKSKS